MGGQGKSEICLQLAHRLREALWGVFWIDASTTELAERSFLDIAQKLSIPAQTWEDAHMGIANLKHSWLLVLDNADDPHVDYQPYFPGAARGVVILTTRNNECQQYATTRPIALEGLCDEQARELLLKAARVPRDRYRVYEEDAKLVASLLRSHPLALIQAGTYVSRGHCTLAEYPGVYERQRQRLLTFRPSQARSRYRDVYATFEASASILKALKTKVAEDALQLLPLLAVCGSSRFPLSFFEAGWKGAQGVPAELNDEAADDKVLLLTPWHVARLPSLLNAVGNAWDSFRLVEAVSLLQAFSLVSTDSHDGCLSVSTHPLVHAWVRDRQDDEEQHLHWLQMGCVIALAYSERTLWQTRGQQLQPHVEALVAWDMGKMFAAESPILVTRVLVNCGWSLFALRADTKLFMLTEKIFARLGLDSVRIEQPWIGLYDLTGRNFINHGRITEGVALLQQVVTIREQSLAESHPNRLASQHALAEAYRANGQVNEAVAMLKRVVTIEEQTLAESHSLRLASQHALAQAYRANGQVKEAVALLKQVVTIEEQTLADFHPDRLTSQHALAQAYWANGQVKEAVALLKQVVTIREQTLTESHPFRLASLHNLAVYLWNLGNYSEALDMMARVTEIRRQVLNEDHPDRQRSEAWLRHFEQSI